MISAAITHKSQLYGPYVSLLFKIPISLSFSVSLFALSCTCNDCITFSAAFGRRVGVAVEKAM